MYPQVFAALRKTSSRFQRCQRPSHPAFFYGLQIARGNQCHDRAGKTLIVRLVNVSEPEKDGRRTVTYELNGMTRETLIADKNLAAKVKHRPKRTLTDPCRFPRRFPG